MPQKVEHTVHILEGKATLSIRKTSPVWQVRYKVGNKWLRTTTKEEDLAKAKSKAVDLVTNAWFRERNSLPTVSKRFRTIANLAIKRMDEETAADRGKASYASYKNALNNYHIPYFKNHNIDSVDYAALQRFATWRAREMTKTPSTSTQNTHNAALKRVFDEAVLRGYITTVQVPQLENRGGASSERRPDIQIGEYPALLRAMRAYIKEGRAGHERDMRLLLRDYVLILANTGIRQGTEMINMRWRDISLTRSGSKEYLTMRVKGKTQKWRTIQVRHRVARYLERIKDRNETLKRLTLRELLARGLDKPVIDATHNADLTTAFGRMFTRMMERAGLLVDTHTGKNRTLYSLRHFYATHELTKGNVTAYQLAEHMGTSIAMLQTHYGHLDLLKLADKFAGEGSVSAALLDNTTNNGEDDA
jgi:integrase